MNIFLPMVKVLLLYWFVITAMASTLRVIPVSSSLRPLIPNSTLDHYITNRTNIVLGNWPRVPFEILVVNIVIRFIYCSPIPDSDDDYYAEQVIEAVGELEERASRMQPDAPVTRFHQEAGPVVLDVRATTAGREAFTRDILESVLGHVKMLFYVNGPASLSARLLFEGIDHIGSFKIFVPFPPEISKR